MTRDMRCLHAGFRSRSVPDISTLKICKRTNCFYQPLRSSELFHSFRTSTKCSLHSQSLQILHQLRWRLRKYIPQTLLRDDIRCHPDQILHDHIKRIQYFHQSSHKILVSKVTNVPDGIPKEQENVFILLDEDALLRYTPDRDAQTTSEVSQQDKADLNSSNIPGWGRTEGGRKMTSF
ncbi:unnamed protein product [Hymenolepis diminuta]|uniref:Uncharacterized protein n=1 Tax=Hymenolepis diminuta TaxID=6216 RepID=A0A564YET6_HYMDI|nr:unnamed protein product [Hymenolepis diminuta]